MKFLFLLFRIKIDHILYRLSAHRTEIIVANRLHGAIRLGQ